MIKRAELFKLAEKIKNAPENQTEEDCYRAFMKVAHKLALQEADYSYALSALFHFYGYEKRSSMTEKKRARVGVSEQDSAAATQYFTPQYIVKYITDNALGKLIGCSAGEFYDGNKDAKLISLDALKNLKITDMAVGTGNILFYAADYLVSAYLSYGCTPSEAKAFTAKNLSGADTDGRAADLARYLLKKRLGQDVEIITVCSPGDDTVETIRASGYGELSKKAADLSVLGSLTEFSTEDVEILDGLKKTEDISSLLATARYLARKYDAVLINPPYLSSPDYPESLRYKISEDYYVYRADLFSVFAARAERQIKDGGYLGAVLPYNFMFIKRYESLRKLLLNSFCIHNLVKQPAGGYRDAVVFLSAFVAEKKKPSTDFTGSYIDIPNAKNIEQDLKRAIRDNAGNKYRVAQSKFKSLPNLAFSFWLSDNFYKNLNGKKLCEFLDIRQGMATGDNKKYLRKIKDVPLSDIAFNADSLDDFLNSNKRYALYAKGGKFRKWYGNFDYVIDLNGDSFNELKERGNRMPSKKYYFKTGITWTLVSSKGVFGARIIENSVFDVGGSCGFPKNPDDLYPILGYLCSTVASSYLNAFNPTLNCQVGDVKKLPYIDPPFEIKQEIERLVLRNVEISKNDFILNFNQKPAPVNADLLFREVQNNEIRLNEIFIELYGLTGELPPEVPERLITLSLCKQQRL